ncbi:hypothetical protein ANN_07411 [Periplaneta americana]|uniref:Ionotropic receptor 75a N-terminal domain-containing protein n=1 Tax=Periplaneta americana TaxID=6978 RepID=A0ABQ8T0T5_PERAM|nr:hypothetical protein ANN_07411 [Periplaneta americana]
MGKGVRVKIQNIDEPVTMSSLLSVDHHKLAVILDWQCERGSYILKEASKNNLFGLLHFWLVFLDNAAENQIINIAGNETNGTRILSSEDPLLSDLESLLILLNSQFTLVRSGSQEDQFLLQDVYRILPRLPLIFTTLRKWSPGQKYPDSPKRNDFGGVTLQSATVVLEKDVWEYFMESRYKHINSFTKKGYAMSERVGMHLNFRLNITPTPSWGFPTKETPTEVVYDGVVGLLQRRKIDMSSTGLIYKLKRMDVIDYSGEIGIFEGTFIFLKPSLSDISNIYTLPFTRSVWLTYFVVLAVLTVAMFISQNAERRMDHSDSTEPTTIADAVMTSIAVVCQEVEEKRDYYFNERREASRTLRNKKRGYLKEKLNEVEANSKNKNIRDLYKGIKEFKNGYQPRVNVIKDENGDLLADSPSILNRWKNYFAQLLHVHRPNRNDRDEIEIQTAEPFIPEPTLSEVEIAIENLKKYKSPGTSRDPKNFSSRILFLSLLMLSLFVTVSYSAIIISLLQTTSSAIQTLTDLMDSPFKLSMKNFSSNTKYINETTDPVVKRLYYTKILAQPLSQAYTSTEVGVKKIRQGMHAFHGDADAYKLISDTFEEHEKCKLKTIDMYPTPICALTVQKGSPLKEHFERSTRWLRESGILDREDKYWIAQFPKCQGHAESFTSVRIQDFYPALLVLAYGAAISVGLLVLENLYSSLKSVKIDKPKTVR